MCVHMMSSVRTMLCLGNIVGLVAQESRELLFTIITTIKALCTLYYVLKFRYWWCFRVRILKGSDYTCVDTLVISLWSISNLSQEAHHSALALHWTPSPPSYMSAFCHISMCGFRQSELVLWNGLSLLKTMPASVMNRLLPARSHACFACQNPPCLAREPASVCAGPHHARSRRAHKTIRASGVMVLRPPRHDNDTHSCKDRGSKSHSLCDSALRKGDRLNALSRGGVKEHQFLCCRTRCCKAREAI